jgi:uncharacterized protein YcnI
VRKLPFLVLLCSGIAGAHPHIDSGPATANVSGQLVTFALSHGCSGKDTVRVKIDIPTGVTSVRALYGSFGGPSDVQKAGTPAQVTSVTWEKASYLVGDNTYPEFTLRMKVPNVPFTTIPFVVTQTCRDASGDTTVVWDQLSGSGNTAPRLTVLPARMPGWNKIMLPVAIAEDDVGTYLGNAQIVWKGAAAYSPNPTVAMLIAMTPGVTAHTGGFAAGDELWVKY